MLIENHKQWGAPDRIGPNGLTILGAIMDGAGRGVPPTVRELMIATGIKNTNGIDVHLKRLQRLGLITRGSGARSLVPTCKFLIAPEEVARIREGRVRDGLAVPRPEADRQV